MVIDDGYPICLLLLDSVFVFLFCFGIFWTLDLYLGEIPVVLTRSPVKGCAVIWLMLWKPVRTVNFVVHLGRHSCHSNNNLRHSSSKSSVQ